MESIVVLVTCASAREAERLGETLVRRKLAACVNLITSPANSIYRWKGKVEKSREVLMMIKTTRKHFERLEKEIRRLHSYETPEIIALPIVAGSAAYLKWLWKSVKR